MDRKFFEENELIKAVVECNFKKVKELILTDYNKPVYDIGGWEKQCPVFILSKAYQIIFEYFEKNRIFNKHVKDNEQIMNLFKSQFSLGNLDSLLIDDYSGLYFETENERTMHVNNVITNFDITDNLNEVLLEEATSLRRTGIIKKLCELGADPYYVNSDGIETMEACEKSISLGLIVVEKLLKELPGTYTFTMIVSIICLARNIQNYEIMTNYTM